MLTIPYRCPECQVTALVPTDTNRMPEIVAQRFRDDPKLAIETECVECIAKQATRLIDIGEMRPDEARIVHMVCGTLHGPEQRCPLEGPLERMN